MGRKLLFVVGLGIGYVIGARAGREKYDRLAASAEKLWQNPRVAKARADVEAYARKQAPIIAERAEAVAKAAPGVIASTAKSVGDRTTIIAKDVAGRTSVVAKDAKAKVTGEPEIVGPLES